MDNWAGYMGGSIRFLAKFVLELDTSSYSFKITCILLKQALSL